MAGFILIAISFFAYGFSSLRERGVIKATDHPTVTGRILSYQTTGRRETRSLVSVRSDAGRRYGVYLDSTVPAIEPADRVTFKYVEETGDEDVFPYFWLFGGIFFSGVGVLSVVTRKRRQQRIASGWLESERALLLKIVVKNGTCGN